VRIWWQSFVDRAESAAYLDQLAEYVAELAGPGTSIDIHGMTPPDRDFGRLTEFRCAALAIDNALEATEQGYDAFVLGHFQDPGLYEARSATRIPVVGLGESSLHLGAQLGRNIALISIHPVFEHWHREQADRYGLGGRVTHVSSLGAFVEDFRAAFEGDEDAYRSMLERFVATVEPLVADGADVVIPAGALPGLLLRRERGLTVGHAPVVNCVAAGLASAELWVRLRDATGLEPSRGPSFSLAPPGAVEDFRTFVREGRRRDS
jgi:allantoin racemase